MTLCIVHVFPDSHGHTTEPATTCQHLAHDRPRVRFWVVTFYSVMVSENKNVIANLNSYLAITDNTSSGIGGIWSEILECRLMTIHLVQLQNTFDTILLLIVLLKILNSHKKCHTIFTTFLSLTFAICINDIYKVGVVCEYTVLCYQNIKALV